MADYQTRDLGQVESRWRDFADWQADNTRARGALDVQRQLAGAALRKLRRRALLLRIGIGNDKRRDSVQAALRKAQLRVAELSVDLPADWVAPWHARRAGSLERKLPARMAECRRMTARISSCASQCRPRWQKTGCGMWKLCHSCSKRRQRRNFKRFADAFAHHADKPLARYLRCSWYMLTLTIRHTGDVIADARTIREGFKRFWRWFTEYPQHRRAMKGHAPQRVRVAEMTDGADNLGHVHYHVPFLFPRGRVDYKKCHWQWRKITAELGNPSCILDFKSGENRQGYSSPEVAAYVAKHSVPTYVCKGEEVDTLSDERAADWLCVTHNKRTIAASPHFFLPFVAKCECCGDKLNAIVLPIATAVVAWQAMTGEVEAGDESG